MKCSKKSRKHLADIHTNERSDVLASQRGFFRPSWRSVKKFSFFPVKNEKLFERSEFFSFREKVKILAPERQPALFFLFLFLCADKGKRKAPAARADARLSVSKFFSFREIRRFFSSGAAAGSLSFCYLFLSDDRKKK